MLEKKIGLFIYLFLHPFISFVVERHRCPARREGYQSRQFIERCQHNIVLRGTFLATLNCLLLLFQIHFLKKKNYPCRSA